MKSSAPVCPVPTEQQPLNEYQSLRESWFYGWATQKWSGYLKPVVILWLLSWLLSAPVASLSFPWQKYPVQFALSGAAGASVLPILTLLQLYLGWVYVRNRLFEATVFYEESGWYDGQTWAKPDELLQRDRLIVSYEIRPILQRLQQTFMTIAALFGLGAIAWNFL
jgi:Conserved in the green lineage and diatoms 27